MPTLSSDASGPCWAKCQSACSPGISKCFGEEMEGGQIRKHKSFDRTETFLSPALVENDPDTGLPRAGPYRVPCRCSMTSVRRYPGVFCGPNSRACKNKNSAADPGEFWVDGANTVIEGYQGNFPVAGEGGGSEP